MSEADKIFIALGYKIRKGKHDIKYYGDFKKVITFDLENELVDIYDYSPVLLDISEIEAIQMKCRELGWKNEIISNIKR